MYRSKAIFNKLRPELINENSNKELLFVEFPNCISKTTGKPFKWLPTHEQVKKLQEELEDVEHIWDAYNTKKPNLNKVESEE